MRTVNYMSKPARLGRIEEPEPMVLFLHPAAIIIAGLIVLLIISALLFAVNGGSAVDSGGMRNFLATGV